MLVADAPGLEGFGFGAAQGRQKQGGKNGDNGNDDQKFDQRKGGRAR